MLLLRGGLVLVHTLTESRGTAMQKTKAFELGPIKHMLYKLNVGSQKFELPVVCERCGTCVAEYDYWMPLGNNLGWLS